MRSSSVANSLAAGAIDIDSRNPNYANQLGHGRIDILRAVRPD
jgi:hypothetical protein